MKAIQVHQPGGPEVLTAVDLPTPEPGPNEVLIKTTLAGVNFADVGVRRGMLNGPHPLELPFVPGFEVIGTVAGVGDSVTQLREGMRVAAVIESGGYAEYVVAPVAKTQPLPDDVDDHAATALLVQGLTADGLLHDAARIQPGETVLIMAAAGGVGSLAVQLAKLASATVIGAVGSAEKAAFVLSLGADHALDYSQPDWAQRLRAATGGKGPDVVLDSVGGRLGTQALEALAPLGRFVMFGAASGPPELPNLFMFNLCGQTFMGYGGPWIRPGAAQRGWQALTDALQRKQLQVVVDHQFPLSEAAAAHRALEERRTQGKIVLTM